ncbi:MAG: hypothetical protein LC676_08905, partial [Loktanella sp.]|nr:hypothetical protein [Loktanella sp.]
RGAGVTDAEKIQQALGDDLEARTLAALVHGFAEARRYQDTLGPLFSPGLSFRDLRRELDAAHAWLMRLAESRGREATALDRLDGVLNGIVRDQWRWADIYITGRAARFSYDPTRSRFERACQELRLNPDRTEFAKELADTIAAFIADLRDPGAGCANRRAKVDAPAIVMLARHFSEATGRAPSAKDDSDFSAYISAFSGMKAPRRHIEAALKSWIR